MGININPTTEEKAPITTDRPIPSAPFEGFSFTRLKEKNTPQKPAISRHHHSSDGRRLRGSEKDLLKGIEYAVSVDGISGHDLKQGNRNDCFLIGTLAAVAQHHPEAIEKMIKPLGPNEKGYPRYEVTFYSQRNGKYFFDDKHVVTLTPKDIRGLHSGVRSTDDRNNPDGKPVRRELWGRIIEKAYVLREARQLGISSDQALTMETALLQTGRPEQVVAAVMGYDTRTINLTKDLSQVERAKRAGLVAEGIEQALSGGKPVMLGSTAENTMLNGEKTIRTAAFSQDSVITDKSGKPVFRIKASGNGLPPNGLVSGHLYTVTEIDVQRDASGKAIGGHVRLRNPQGQPVYTGNFLNDRARLNANGASQGYEWIPIDRLLNGEFAELFIAEKPDSKGLPVNATRHPVENT